jgi:hypothetical protein
VLLVLVKDAAVAVLVVLYATLVWPIIPWFIVDLLFVLNVPFQITGGPLLIAALVPMVWGFVVQGQAMEDIFQDRPARSTYRRFAALSLFDFEIRIFRAIYS